MNQQYQVTSDERWDNIAYKAYGNAAKVYPLIEANPDVAILDIVPAGTILLIPIFPEESEEINTDLLPPWMN